MTTRRSKPLFQLRAEDFEAFPVWQLEDGWSNDEQQVFPVDDLPVADLSSRVVGAIIVLANGQSCWGILGNISLASEHATSQFLTLSVERDNTWFDLARYHDADYSRRGPAELARFLSLSVEQVFPITYDISRFAIGLPEVTKAEIAAIPKKTLTQTELIELALE